MKLAISILVTLGVALGDNIFNNCDCDTDFFISWDQD